MPTRRAFLPAAGLLPLAVRLPAGPAAGETVRAVVAADGSGDFRTIQRAVDHVLDHPPGKRGRRDHAEQEHPAAGDRQARERVAGERAEQTEFS